MTTAADLSGSSVAWWKEPTREQWLAWVAAWLGWTLDAFDFTMFLLIMVPISQEFHVPLTDVAFVLSVTLWLRLVGAVGWLADRVGRKIPLMISILWYSLSNFAAGFSPTFTYLFLFRALLGIGMGGEWPAGGALAMETWPVRSRGFMGGVLQGSWGLGFMLSSGVYGLFYASIGWRGMLWIGVLPALSVFFVRKFVKEPPIWLENRRRQRLEQREVRAPLIAIFQKQILANTLTACVWLGGGFIAYYSVNALFATHLQKDLHLTPGLVATPIFFANLGTFLASCGWGWWADRIGRRWSTIIPALIALPLAPLYLLSTDFLWIAAGFIAQGMCAGGGMQGQMVAYLNERFPTEIRATASAFCYHQAGIFGGFVPVILTFLAEHFGTGLAEPMIIGTWIGCIAWAVAVFYGPETKGKILVPDLVVA
ncbi:MAG TPA: MFS transporter [Bradyrhizobium sp.]|jgi:SHS family lactate transporter-like MFS transporter|nr:MFS transporter [Bradyrhizobium sp.]